MIRPTETTEHNMSLAPHTTHVEPVTANAGRLRLIAILLTVFQAFALGVLSNGWIYPALAVIAGVIALRSNREQPVHSRIAFRLVSLGVLLFIGRYLIAPPQFPRGVLAVRTQLFHVVAQFLVAYQIGIVYLTPRHTRLPQMLPWLGVLALLCAANVQVSPRQRWIFQTLAVLFMLLLVAWTGMARPFIKQLRPKSNSRTIWIGICMLFTAVLTWVSATLLNQYENDLDDLISQFIQQNDSVRETGFSGDGRLESVTRMHSSSETTVALRVDSETPPDYLRGSAFVVYGSQNWLAPREHPRRLTPIDLPETSSIDKDRGNVFALRGCSSSQLQSMSRLQCWPNPAGDGAIFSTVNSEFIQFNVEQTEINAADIVDEDMLPVGYPYQLFQGRADAVRPLHPNIKGQLTAPLALPSPEASQRVAELAQTLFADSQSDEDRLAAVKQHFASYEYSESTHVPPNRDPIEWFLLDQPSGHCEFFASATVALLRQARIPSRYVTGFMITEQNLYGNYWVARNRDAHAWAEAWLPDQGWVVVETTPSSGIPQQSAPSTARQLMEYLQSSLQTFRVQLSVGGIRWLLRAVLTFLINPLTMLFIALVFTLFWLRRRNRTRKTMLDLSERTDPQVVKLNRLLTKMDERVAGRFQRLPYETLHQFAERIETAVEPTIEQDVDQETKWAKWYRQYANVRFGRVLDDEAIASLETP